MIDWLILIGIIVASFCAGMAGLWVLLAIMFASPWKKR